MTGLLFALLSATLPFTGCTARLLVQPASLHETVVIPGGSSPDGRYEIRASRHPEFPGTNDYFLWDTRRLKCIRHLSDGGPGRFPGLSEAAWAASGTMFALAHEDPRHIWNLQIFVVTRNGVTTVNTPDFLQMAQAEGLQLHKPVDQNPDWSYARLGFTDLAWKGSDLHFHINHVRDIRKDIQEDYDVVTQVTFPLIGTPKLSLKRLRCSPNTSEK